MQVMRKLQLAKLYIVFEKEAVDAVYAHLDKPQDAFDHVYKLVGANILGKSMFQDTMQSVLSSKTSQKISEGIHEKLGGQVLTSELWKKTCRELIKDASEADPARLLKQRRQASVVYRGRSIMVRVSSLLPEVEFWLGAKLKEQDVFAQDLLICS